MVQINKHIRFPAFISYNKILKLGRKFFFFLNNVYLRHQKVISVGTSSLFLFTFNIFTNINVNDVHVGGSNLREFNAYCLSIF